MQNCSISSFNTLEILQSCTRPLKCSEAYDVTGDGRPTLLTQVDEWYEPQSIRNKIQWKYFQNIDIFFRNKANLRDLKAATGL